MQKKRPFLPWLIFGIVVIVIGAVAYVMFMPSANETGLSAELAAMQTVELTRGPLTVVIGATGTVRSNQQTLINWQTSGKVGEVLVTLGQLVQADETLASLDPNTISPSIIQARADLINAEANLEELQKPQPLKIAQAETALEQAQEDLDTLLNPSESDLAQAELAIVTARDAVTDAQKAVDKLARPRYSTELIEQARASYLIAQSEVDRLQSVYENTPGDPNVDAGKALALSNLAAAETKRDRALATVNWYLGSPTDEEIIEKNTQLLVAQGQLSDAIEKLEKLKNPKPTDIELAKAKVNDAQEALDQAKAGPTADDLAVAQTRITLAQANLEQAALTAPFGGTITQISVMQGDMVNAGKTAFRLDDLSRLFVDLDVSEIDIAQIQVGQAVQVTFDAIPDKAYAGVVSSIGLVGTVAQSVVYFPVTVQLTDADAAVKPGMTAVANVIISEVDDVLQLPNRAIQSKDGERFVYVLRNNAAERVVIKVGMSSDTASQVLSDELQEGNVIFLGTPSTDNSPSFGPGSGNGGGPFGGGQP
jgi:HlyD family secretion protein